MRPVDPRRDEQKAPAPGLFPSERAVCHHPSHAFTLRRRPGSEFWSVKGFRVPLRERPRLSTPGVLGSGPSYVVSDHQGLLRPHPSVPQARNDFTAWPLIRRAFAVRVRLGDPRDLPYFHYRSFQACRRPYAGGFEVLSRYACAPRCQASSLCPRVATHKIPPLPAILGGDLLFRRGIVRFMLRPVCLPRPPDWLRRDAVT